MKLRDLKVGAIFSIPDIGTFRKVYNIYMIKNTNCEWIASDKAWKYIPVEEGTPCYFGADTEVIRKRSKIFITI